MMTAIRMGGFALALALAGTGVQAKAEVQGATSIWEGCGENKVSGFSKFMVGPTAARNQNPKATAQEGLARCSEALGSLDSAAPWQRRAALLRSRAKYYVMARNPSAAIADLEAIAAIERPDEVYARSFAVSVHMLRAVAQIEGRQWDAAAKEAIEAMRLRPWSERVAQFAFVICAMRDVVPIGEGAQWDHLVMLDGAFAERRAVLLARAGDWDGAVADWLRVSPAPGAIGQTYVNLPNVVVNGAPGIPVKGVDVRRTVDAILTAAMAGRADLVESWQSSLRTNIDVPPTVDGLAKRLGVTSDPAAQKAEMEKWAELITVAKLAGGGGIADAAHRLDAMTTIPISAVSTAMMRSIAAKSPADARLRNVLAKIDEQAILGRIDIQDSQKV